MGRSDSRTPSPEDEMRSPSKRQRDRSYSRERDRRHRSRSRSRSRSPRHRHHSGSPRRRHSRRSRSDSREDRGNGRHDHEDMESRMPDQMRTSYIEVKRNPENFDTWMGLLTLAERENDMVLARFHFDRFLERYPYCYGFWKKYADMERRLGNFSEALKVWERGILAIPLSIDLWLGFLAFMRECAPETEGKKDKLRALCSRALSVAGLEFNSDALWLDVISWEQSEGDMRRVMEIYDRLIKTPTAQHKEHLNRLEFFINGLEPNVIVSDEEYDELFDLVRRHLDIGIDQIATEETTVESSDTSSDTDEKPVLIRRKKHNPEALAFMRAEIMARRRRWSEDTTELINARATFEEQIKRPYFHVKPLEKAQLANWRAYLDFEIERGDRERVAVLFERCLIACALYEEFWVKYARWMSKARDSNESARDVYKRAMVHCSKKVNLHLGWSAFEEAAGDISHAVSILETFNRKNPGYIAVNMRLIGIERRKAESTGKKPDYADVLSRYERLISMPETTRQMVSYYSIKLARFHLKCRDDRRLAEKVLRRALERDRENLQLYLQLIDLEYNNPDFSQTAVVKAFDEALNAKISTEDKVRISQRKLDFLEDLTYNIELLQEHQEAHSVLLTELSMPVDTTRKRRHDDRQTREESSRRRSTAYQQQQPQQGYYVQQNMYQPQVQYQQQPQQSYGYAGSQQGGYY